MGGDLRAEERQELERVIKRAAFRREIEALSSAEVADFAERGVAAPTFDSEVDPGSSFAAPGKPGRHHQRMTVWAATFRLNVTDRP